MMVRGGMIKKLRDRRADFFQARPIQIAKHDALSCLLLRRLDETHLRSEVAPRLAVVDEPVDPLPQLRVHRVVKFALPPKIKRQVRIEMRENDARHQIRARPFKTKSQP